MPSVLGLELGDPPAAWAALGLGVARGRCRIGGVELALTGAGGGIRGWTLAGVGGPTALDGLPTRWAGVPAGEPQPAAVHPLGALGIDHVVITRDALERTSAALAATGAEVRRIREPPEAPVRQAFHRLGEVVAEVVEAPGGPVSFWGLAVVVADLDAAAARLAPARATVQPGRRIATVRREAGVGTRLALMTPRPRALG